MNNKEGSNNPNWKGGAFINENGYKRIKVDGKYRYEHRHLMETHLGRRLNPREHVHHINGDKLDNRLENLVVMSSRDHAKHHASIAPSKKCWVCEELGKEVIHYCGGFCKTHYAKYRSRVKNNWY